MKKNTAIMSIIAVGILGLLGGFEYGKAKTTAPIAGSMRRGAAMAGGFAGRSVANGGPTTGTVIAKDDKSITIAMQGTGSKIVFTDETTQVLKSTAGTMTDVATGDTIIVTGTTNSDGSLSAKSIQIRPAMQPLPEQMQHATQ
jgi:ABC-type proline/glycine betaine transport system substrate-binding protein